MINYAIIAGTGFSEHAASFEEVATDYGIANIGHIQIGNKDVLFIKRHARLETPNKLNYRANIEALKLMGTESIFGISACGRITDDVLPGHLVMISNVYRTWGLGERKTSFAEEGLLLHTAPPFFNQELAEVIQAAWNEIASSVNYPAESGLTTGYHDKGIYVIINGPSFDDPVEEKIFKTTAALAGFKKKIVIGMTLFPETTLSHELGMDYHGLAMCTDYSSTPPEGARPVTHGGVTDASTLTGKVAFNLISKTIERVPADYQPKNIIPVIPGQVDFDELNNAGRQKLVDILRGPNQ